MLYRWCSIFLFTKIFLSFRIKRKKGKISYGEVRQIYKKKKDMEHYVTYLTLYTEVINSKRQSFSSEYIVYSQELYDYNTWKKKELY